MDNLISIIGIVGVLFIIGFVVLIVFLFQLKKRMTTNNDLSQSESNEDITISYNSKWLFSYNEKDAFRKIKTVTDKLGFTLLAKVRLYDLVEPKKGSEKYRTLKYKIQAKHVDFVVCDEKLVARTIIELDDSSHNSSSRQERDTFVDQVLTNCGYTVLRYKAINADTLENDLKQNRPQGAVNDDSKRA